MYTPRLTRYARQMSENTDNVESFIRNKRKYVGSGIMPTIQPIGKSRDGDDDDDDDSHVPFNFPKMFGSHAKDVYTEKNHIFFKTDVNEESIDKLSQEIDNLNYKLRNMSNKTQFGTFNPKPIILHITTRGGDLLSGFFAFDKIRNSKIPIHTVIEGSVASAGSIMSIAGSYRYITPTSHVLIHQLRTGMMGTYEDLKDEKQNCTNFMNKLVNLYYENCNSKLSKTKIKEFLKRDLFWDSKEAIKYGIVDEIWKNKVD